MSLYSITPPPRIIFSLRGELLACFLLLLLLVVLVIVIRVVDYNYNTMTEKNSDGVTASDVLLYVPNLLGYVRVVLTVSSYALLLMDSSAYWFAATLLYLGSFVGDLFDGWMARKLNQTSSFGGVLDMVTDRCSTLGFLFLLSTDYRPVDADLGLPLFQATFLFLVLLDVSSHWCQMYASLSCGQHHKSEAGNKGRNFLVRWFYKYYYFFGYLCCGAEFTYMLLLVKRHAPDEWQIWVQLGLAVCVPGCVAKQFVNVAQLTSSCYAIATSDAEAKQKKR